MKRGIVGRAVRIRKHNDWNLGKIRREREREFYSPTLTFGKK